MNSFASRRLSHIAVTLAIMAAVVWWLRWSDASLAHTAFDSGYLLLAAIFFLALYNVRKKLPILPWTTSSGWLQVHIYVGLASAVVFGLHIDWRLPDGVLETSIAVLYAATFVSGIVGLTWSRSLPAKLSGVSEEVIYERIPMLRSQLYDRAQSAVLETVRSTGATTLGKFYSEQLHHFFEYPRNLRYYLRPNNRRRRTLLAELTEINRYLSEPEQQTSELLFSLVRRRDDLDYQSALQWRLKAWLFVHIGLTYPLVIVACLHGWLAHLFDGGAL